MKIQKTHTSSSEPELLSPLWAEALPGTSHLHHSQEVNYSRNMSFSWPDLLQTSGHSSAYEDKASDTPPVSKDQWGRPPASSSSFPCHLELMQGKVWPFWDGKRSWEDGKSRDTICVSFQLQRLVIVWSIAFFGQSGPHMEDANVSDIQRQNKT